VAVEATVVIEATPQGFGAQLKSLWRYRGFYGFLFREITMRKFKDTLLGFWWLILRPLVATAMFVIPFTFVAPMTAVSDVPYPIFFLSGFLVWNLFHTVVTYTPRTLLWMRGVMRRTYFPRLLVPLAGFGSPLIECAVLAVVLLLTVGVYWVRGGVFPLVLGWHTLLLLPCMAGALLFGLSIGMIASVVALFFRDVVFTMGYLIQGFMLLTPVVYPVSFIPVGYQWVLFVVNPMAQLVLVGRFAITGQGSVETGFFALSLGMGAAAFLASTLFFLRAERFLADEL